jgi:hypothetical protein
MLFEDIYAKMIYVNNAILKQEPIITIIIRAKANQGSLLRPKTLEGLSPTNCRMNPLNTAVVVYSSLPQLILTMAPSAHVCHIWLFWCAFLLDGAHAEGWDDFSNNLSTDLSPLLALFGEQVTKQFLSEYLSPLDNLSSLWRLSAF